MTAGELVRLLTEPFQEDFAGQIARQVRATDSVGELYRLVTSPDPHLSRSVKHKVLFRGAYVLEKIYFEAPVLFTPYVETFYADFPACTDASAKRHFGKIMVHLLQKHLPAVDVLEPIAASAAEWAIEPEAKVAVKVWAIEVLKCCRERVGWVAESWDDMLAAMEQDATPGIACRLRKNWKKV